jgi:outer membrane receptor protein involved in Fe transport
MSTSSKKHQTVFFSFTALTALILILSASIPAHSQAAGGTFTGTVTDSSGGVLPNAQVTIKDAATGISTTTATNADGIYRVPNLLPATYEITVAARGFATVVQSGVQLTVGATEALNFSLKVGQVTEQVQVTGEAAAVELASSSLSATVSSSTVRELPLNGRDWASLATLQPGVAVVHSQDQVSNPGGHARGLGLQMSINGARPTQNSYRLNGILVNDYSNAGPGNALGQNLGVDAIQEFSVLTSNYSTEYGYTSGGVINAITRSGTNTFHGSAYEFLRNNALDARNFFDYTAAPKRDAPFRRNQFGGSAGGPIKKDKAFIFGAYEGLRQNKGFSVIDKTLSNNARVGILDDANGNPLPPLAGSCPYPDSTNMAPGQAAVCVDNTIQKFLTFYPAANGSLLGVGNSAQYAYSSPQIVPENYYTVRGDVRLSDKDNLNASWFYDHSTWSQPGPLNQVLVGFILMREAVSLEETHVFSPTMVNTLRGGYNRSTVNGQVGLSAINPAAADTSLGLAPGFYAPGFRNAGGGSGVPGLTKMNGGLDGTGIQNYVVQNFQFYDDALRTMGKHSLKFGGMYLPYQDNVFAPFDQDGRAAFSSISDMLQNKPNFLQASLNLGKIFPHDLRTKIFAGYIQDDWKVRPNLTLNLGLRYEANTIPTETRKQIENLPTQPTDPGICSAVGAVTSNCEHLNNFFFASNPSTKNFEPRVGFSWDPFHNGKTAVRGGFGMFDALLLPYQLALNSAQTSPYHVAASVFGPPQGSFQVGPDNPNNYLTLIQQVPLEQLSPLILWNYVEPNPKRNYVEQWNLNIQRQITPSTTVTVTYAGSHTWHNPFQEDDTNTVFPMKTPAGYLWPNPIGTDGLGHSCSSPLAITSPSANPAGSAAACQQTSNSVVVGQAINSRVAQIQSTLWNGKAWYHALQVEVEKRMSRGLQIQASYTWSKTEDTSSGSFAGDNFASNLSPTTPWYDLSIVKGLSDFHVGQNLVINALWNVPTPKSLAGPAGWIARGWQLGGIVTLQTGVPVWAIIGNGDGDLLGQLNSEPISIPDRLGGGACGSLTNSRSFMLANSMQYIKADPTSGVPTCFTVPTAPNQDFYNANCDKSFTFPTCANLMGNNGRNSITGPGIENFDFSMVKDNPIRKISESFNIQFRAEFFNIFNRANFAPPNAVNGNLEAFDGTGAPVGGFGQITSTSTPERQVQFALKIIW